MPDANHTELGTQIEVRVVNEWIRDANEWLGSLKPFEMYHCECGDGRCDSCIGLTDAEYEAVRAEWSQFIVAQNHEQPDQQVISQRRRFAVVKPLETWASMAAWKTDPRGN
jgi:hypothetical protein